MSTTDRIAQTAARSLRRTAAQMSLSAGRTSLALASTILGREDAKGVLLGEAARCLRRLDRVSVNGTEAVA
jgi:hypothetical protein